MKLLDTFLRSDMWPIRRFTGVVIVVCVIDCLAVLMLRKPLPLAAIIPATIPLWVVVFVILPMQKKKL